MSISKSKKLAELEKKLAEQEKWVRHFEDNECFDTVFHTNAANLRGAIKVLKGKAPKRATIDIGPEEEKENGT